ncbi:MAG: membrane protein insertase YidC [Thermoanaerobaculia bacterium]
MEKRLLIALALSFLVLILWSKLFVPPEPQVQKVEEKAEKKEEVSIEKKEEVKEEPFEGEVKEFQEREFLLENEYFKIHFTNKGARIKEIELKKYLDYNKKPLSLFPKYNPVYSPLNLNFQEENLNKMANGEFYKGEFDGERLTFYLFLPEIKIKKAFFIENGFLKCDFEVEKVKNFSISLGPGLRDVDPREENNKFLLPANFVYNDFKGIERKAITKFGKKMPSLELEAQAVKYFGLEDSYFLSVIIPEKGFGKIKVFPEKNIFFRAYLKKGFNYDYLDETLKERVFWDEENKKLSLFGTFTQAEKEKIKNGVKDPKESRKLEALLQRNFSQLFIEASSKEKNLSLSVFFGAKDLEYLKKNQKEFVELVNFGFFSFIAKPLLWILKGINGLVHNWGFSIIILTFLLRIALYPINHKQIVSMKKMQKIQPKIEAIRKKYKNALKDMEERAKMNQEIMEAYKKEGINPLGGCLPLAVQIPILWAFYSMLTAAIELRNSPFIFWIKDLSSRDPYYITPILMGVAMLWQQKMTPATGTGSQKFLMNMMPIFFTFLFLNFPSGVVLYWFMNTVLQIVQTYIYKWHTKEV